MKNFLLILFLFAASIPVFAQVTVAEDWTKTDCSGTEHNLFSELDAGNVVIMELVMLGGCMPCINAAHLMQPVIDFYNENYENRVHWYSMGFDDSYSCLELTDWKLENDINTTASFIEGDDQVSYYGGMGMPTIIIAGRNTHQVYFNKFGFVPSDTVGFADAIEYALGLTEPLGLSQSFSPTLKIYPNPVSDILYVHDALETSSTLRIFDITGNTILEASNVSQLEVQNLPVGIYLAQFTSDSVVTTLHFMKK